MNFLYWIDFIFKSVYRENNRSNAHVVFPVPLLPIIIAFPLNLITYLYCVLKLYSKLGIFYKNGTNLAEFEKFIELLFIIFYKLFST